jgi:hypothetical protein
MSKTTTLAEGQITPSPHNTITIELVEADETPAVVIVSWPLQPTVLHPGRFPEAAAAVAKLFATASTELFRINARKRTH